MNNPMMKGSLWVNVKVNGTKGFKRATLLRCCLEERWWTESGGTLKYIITYDIK